VGAAAPQAGELRARDHVEPSAADHLAIGRFGDPEPRALRRTGVRRQPLLHLARWVPEHLGLQQPRAGHVLAQVAALAGATDDEAVG
jgi:hypothetical protein